MISVSVFNDFPPTIVFFFSNKSKRLGESTRLDYTKSMFSLSPARGHGCMFTVRFLPRVRVSVS